MFGRKCGMKKNLSKKIALILTLALVVPICWNQNAAIASAATPTFTVKEVTIDGEGEVYPLIIQDQVKGSTYKWSSSKTSIARISTKGIITTIAKGSTTIKCKITYPTKKTKTISCNVIVKVSATDIAINNAKEVNGAHVLLLGEKYDFNTDIVPVTTSDMTYWSVGGGDSGCISITDETNGMVTATKAGKVILVATAAASKAAAAKSIVNEAIIIEVVGPTATVKSVEITDSTLMKIVFDSPIDKNTVIGANNKLSDNIVITTRKDTKQIMAKDPGNLTASLSSDLMTLSITSTNMFSGDYGVNVSKNIKTTNGLAIEEYFKLITFADVTPPSITNVELDDTGMISTIRFSEAIDLSSFIAKFSSIYSTTGTVTYDAITKTMIENELNYMLSEDKKSLSINLSGIPVTDYGKSFTVNITGIKDMAGISPAGYVLTVNLSTDISPKAQAFPYSITRTGYNTLTVTYSRAIQTPGFLFIGNGSLCFGVVDTKDNMKVNYTISSVDALLTGLQKVTLNNWNGYNVSKTDTTPTTKEFTGVNFSVDTTSPWLLDYKFDETTSILTLTYNKDVSLNLASGVFSSKIVTVSEDIMEPTNISYSKLASTDNKVINLSIGNMKLFGKYTFTMPQGFVTDGFKNMSLLKEIVISNVGSTSGELPGPYLITQSTTNPSMIYLEFMDKLDAASAQTLSNYSIPGVIVISAVLTKNNAVTGATVLLTVAEGTITATVQRPIIITGVKGYNGTYAAMSATTKTVELKDNMKPTMLVSPTFDQVTRNRIKLSFNEDIAGTAIFKVTKIYGATSTEIANAVTIVGNSVYITLSETAATNTLFRIEVITNNLSDLSGNTVTLPSPMNVLASYN